MECSGGKYQEQNTAASVSCKYCSSGKEFNTISTDCKFRI